MSLSIDLILFTQKNSSLKWPYGKIQICPRHPDKLKRVTETWQSSSTSDYVLFWDDALPLPPQDILIQIIQSPGQVWHAGLRLGLSGYPKVMDFVHPTWMLNRDPDPKVEATSWRLSLRAALVRKDVLESMGFIHEGFDSLESAGLELGYRWIRNGVSVRHIPDLVKPAQASAWTMPVSDEVFFAGLHFPIMWNAWMLLRNLLSPVHPRWSFLLSVLKTRAPKGVKSSAVRYALPHSKKQHSGKDSVSVLIPTLNRYPYLKVLLQQMRVLDPAPLEILIIDQSTPEFLDTSFYEPFRDLPLVVEYQKEPGQCTSRNRGLNLAKGEYILFLDDDDEIPADLIARHLANLMRNQAEVSCGVAHERGMKSLPSDFTYPRVSDVFPTNNSMIKKSLLQRSGLFDLAYNKGSRADADLGTRLYLSGALMSLDPGISVLHHHAPSGGLREHRERVITYHSSRGRLLHRHLPSVTEIYKAKRYFTSRQAAEMIWIFLAATFQVRGALFFRGIKIFIGLLLLPATACAISFRMKKAQAMLSNYPQIPPLDLQPS